MRVLLTSTRLDLRAGAQMFVRDLARALQALGHSVMAFGSDPRQQERLLENDVIPVATDLDRLPFKPDIIHAQHHLDAMATLMALPGVPAIYHCNGAIWTECPPRHPRIYRYLSMSRTLAERMSIESGIAPSDISLFLNPVDLARFAKVRQPPEVPSRALFFNSRHDENSETVAAIREAVARCGMTLDFVGPPFGRNIEAPEQVLPLYDLVFASGRSAIEAAASGCAVIILGRTSCGPLVRPENYENLRQANFSIAVNSPGPTVDGIERELRLYSAAAAAEVTSTLRKDADIVPAAKDLLANYQEVINLHQNTAQDLPAEILAISKYLRKIVPLIMTTDSVLGRNWMSASRAGSLDELSARLARVEKSLGTGRQQVAENPANSNPP